MSTPHPPDASAGQDLWLQGERLRQGGHYEQAANAFSRLTNDPEWIAPARLRLSQFAQRAGRPQLATWHAVEAAQAAESDPIILEAVCHSLFACGELELALQLIQQPALANSGDAQILESLGAALVQQSLPDLALPLLQRASALAAPSPRTHYLIGLCCHYLGHIERADLALRACLAQDPGYAAAHWIRAKLARATPARHHIDALRRAIAQSRQGAHDFLLHYALFKELDDLGEHAAAWPALEQALRLHRATLAYDESAEQRLFDELHQVAAGSGDSAGPADDGPQPLFIVGMPRTGSTLLEAILASHPQIADAGELRDFVCQMRWVWDVSGPPQLDVELASRARDGDFALLGQRYLQHTRWHSRGRPLYTDKLPSNFLALGYLARALPRARFLHITRDAMDTCLSNLKEPFVDGYPHSNAQGEMGRHYRRYQGLMAHWKQQYPDRILDVSYESLVADSAAVADQVFRHCGLDPMPGTATPMAHRAATASAGQLREPIHGKSIGRWCHYADQLDELRDALQPS